MTVCYIVSVKKLFLPQMISCSHSITPAWLFFAFEFIPTSNAVDIRICNSYEYQYPVLLGHMAIIRYTRDFHRFSYKMSNLHNPKLPKLIVVLCGNVFWRWLHCIRFLGAGFFIYQICNNVMLWHCTAELVARNQLCQEIIEKMEIIWDIV